MDLFKGLFDLFGCQCVYQKCWVLFFLFLSIEFSISINLIHTQKDNFYND